MGRGVPGWRHLHCRVRAQDSGEDRGQSREAGIPEDGVGRGLFVRGVGRIAPQ